MFYADYSSKQLPGYEPCVVLAASIWRGDSGRGVAGAAARVSRPAVRRTQVRAGGRPAPAAACRAEQGGQVTMATLSSVCDHLDYVIYYSVRRETDIYHLESGYMLNLCGLCKKIKNMFSFDSKSFTVLFCIYKKNSEVLLFCTEIWAWMRACSCGWMARGQHSSSTCSTEWTGLTVFSTYHMPSHCCASKLSHNIYSASAFVLFDTLYITTTWICV